MTRSRRLLGPMVALCLLGGCSQVGAFAARDEGGHATYPVPIERAAELIAPVEEPPMVFGDGPITFRLSEESATRLVWSVSQQDVEALRYTAVLEPAPGGTIVDLSLVGIASKELGNVEERLTKLPSVRRVYLIAMQEAIAAELERRPFRMDRLYPAMVDATFEVPDIWGDSHREAAVRRDRENMKKAYREETW